jgi:hypothetical protein
MAVPGNIYNTILMDDNNEHRERQEVNGDALCIFLIVSAIFIAILCLYWGITMHKEGC